MPSKLAPHQEEVLPKLSNGKILYGEPGSGKSRVALAYFSKKENTLKTPKKLYIITTARKRDEKEWEDECLTMGVSLEIVTVDSWHNIGKYVEVCDAFFIFDEQRLVGSGVWVKTFLKIVKSNRWILLSGTPGDTWSDYIPVFVANGFYKNRTAFLKEHAVYSTWSKYPKIDRFVGGGKLNRLRRSILVPMDFKKKTVPHREYVTTLYDKDLFDLVLKKRWNPYKDKPIKEASEYFHVMRRVVNSDPSRLEVVRDIHKKKKKVIVFYSFDYELDILRTLKCRDVAVFEWNGHKHEPVPESDSWIYLVQYTAASEAWNCTSTDTIIFYSLNYSYKVLKQSEGRIDRMNTPFTDLYYYVLRSQSKIDNAILKALRQKKNFNESSFK